MASVLMDQPGTSGSTTKSNPKWQLPPEVVKDLVLNKLKRPTVFRNMIDHWPCRHWSLDEWAKNWGPKQIRFRVGPIHSDVCGPLWEADCNYVEGTMTDFVEWQTDTDQIKGISAAKNLENGLLQVDSSRFWVYADYKHLGEIFDESDEIHNAVDWGPFGFTGRRGEASTVWMGSAKSQTPCHYDTYGCNLVAQIFGRKKWIMFAPADTQNLYPTRIPYEESSVFSRVDITNPDVKKFPKFQFSTPYIINLEPGDVLFVPPKWWHFVSLLETAISINSWIETSSDDAARLEESITRALITSLMDTYPLRSIEWLNPTEEEVPPEVNIRYVWESLNRCLKSVTTSPSAGSYEQKPSKSDDSKIHHTLLPQVERLCEKTSTELIRAVTPSSLEHLIEEAALKKDGVSAAHEQEGAVEKSEATSSGTELPYKEDRMRTNLINAIVDPEVISLISEKFKRSILSENPQ